MNWIKIVKYAKIIVFNLLAILFILALYESLMYLLIHRPALLARMPRGIQNSAGYLYSAGGRKVIQLTPACAQYDRELGYTLRPGRCSFSGTEFDNLYRVNRLGVRDDEQSLDHPEIIVAGDSVAMGWGVNQEETFAQLLEKKTGRIVLNAAVSSYGTAREMLILRRVPTDRLKTLVIQYSGNDYDENKTFYLDHNILKTMDEATYRHYVENNERPQDYYLGKYLLLKLKKGRPERGPALTKERPVDKDDVDLFLNAILHSGLQLDEVRIIAFIVNGRDPRDNREFTASLKQKIAAGNYPPFIRKMIVLDMSRILGQNDFYVLDDHPNRSGHQAIAKAVFDVIGKN